MMITWNREVAIPLTDLKQEKNVLNSSLKMFKKLLTSDINKVYGRDVRAVKSKSHTPELFLKESIGIYIEDKNILDLESQSDDGLPSPYDECTNKNQL